MTIEVRGDIVNNTWGRIAVGYGYQVTSPEMVEEALAAESSNNVDVIVESPGGEVSAGSEIYTLLRGSGKNIRVIIPGLAASAASVIAMAGNEVVMSPTARIMIHNAHGWATDKALDVTNNAIANAYALKTGIKHDELRELMLNETWMTAGEAIKNGFADGLLFDEGKGADLVASVGQASLPRLGGTEMAGNMHDAVDDDQLAVLKSIDARLEKTVELLSTLVEQITEETPKEEKPKETETDPENKVQEMVDVAVNTAFMQMLGKKGE